MQHRPPFSARTAGAAALALGVGILLTQILSFKALVILEAAALVASGVLYFLSPPK